MSQQEKEWDKHTSSIHSLSSDELHETRPNRWTGPASTWRKLTAPDRDVWQALEAGKGRDLGVHLVNAYALRRRGADGRRAEGRDGDGDGEERWWAPDRTWTAWPLGVDRVPRPDFLGGVGGEEEGDRTFRRPWSSGGWVGGELEEEVGAAMLRLAKEKFRSRGLGNADKQPKGKGVEGTGAESGGGEESDGSAAGVKDEVMSGVETEGAVGAEDQEDGGGEVRSPGLVPTVAIDDEVSYELLRPVARHILSKLDQTLTVLHNARLAVVDSGSDSEEDEKQEGRGTELKKSPKRKTWTGDDTDTAPGRPSSRGTRHTPQEGETDREMQVRLAKKYHRRVPRFSDEEGETTAAETAGSSKDRKKKKVRVTTRSMARDISSKPDSHSDRGSRLDRLALRDWSDVLGAAALAGFSPNVIVRATQRCSDLFGQGMEFNTLYEQPATGRANKSRSTRFTPGLATTDEESDEQEGYRSEAEQIRAVSREPSVIANDSSSEDGEAASTPGTPGRGRRKGRGYSVAPSVVRLYCPHANCSGAINGFTRRYNLKQHLITVHGKTPEVLSEDDDDMDEMHGAVHVDGFLKPIRPRKGWRAADTGLSNGRRQQRRGYRKTGSRLGTPPPRQFYSDTGYHAEADEEDMIRDADDGD